MIEVAASIASELAALDVDAAYLARNIATNAQLGFEFDRVYPLASVVKVPIALVVADRCARGIIDPASQITLRPESRGPGPFGISALKHPVTMAVADLTQQMVALSDNAAADALLDLVGVEAVDDELRSWGVDGLRIRQPLRAMYEAASRATDQFDLGRQLAVLGWRNDGSHVIDSLDVRKGNAGSAMACVDLTERIWTDAIASPEACAFVRDAMKHQIFTHRLGGDLQSDEISIAGKTGTFLNLRHEIAVIGHDCTTIVVAALTASRRVTRIRADVDLALARAARLSLQALRT
jgi:beta-lactamase class A